MTWLRIEFWWAVHNLVAHPAMHLLWWASLFGCIPPVARLAEWIHEATVPRPPPPDGDPIDFV
jgi:hypothetical protein